MVESTESDIDREKKARGRIPVAFTLDRWMMGNTQPYLLVRNSLISRSHSLTLSLSFSPLSNNLTH